MAKDLVAKEEFRARGMQYYTFLAKLHGALRFDWYMEIGCRAGKSFGPISSNTVAVDPFFQIETNVVSKKSRLHIIQETSDSFFESQFLEKNDIKPDLAFLDGMHHFEFLLRDFIGTERNAKPHSVVMMHDICPWTSDMTTRGRDDFTGKAWTGDVWKVIPILQKYRPDLDIQVLDARPTGLGVVRNLDPGNTVLTEAYDDIMAEFLDLDIADFGFDTYYGSFNYTRAGRHANGGFGYFTQAGTPHE
ncbi:MAG: class I SAM-dependent methyltransferase [Pseudomonadota bacterium]